MQGPFTSNWLEITAFLILGLAVSWGVISLILYFNWPVGSARSGMDFHHGRQTSVPRLGGVGLITAFTAISAAVYFLHALPPQGAKTLGVIVLSSLAMFALGFWDDFHPLRAQWKLAGQIAIA